MSIATVDAKRRVVLPAVRPGDVFDVQRLGEGRLVLVRLERPTQAAPMSKRACLAAMRQAPLRLAMKWERLRPLTREP